MARHPSCASNATQVTGQLLPGTPRADFGPILDDEGASDAPNPDDGGNCHQDRQSCHDPGQPARRDCLPFGGRLVSLDRDPQAVHGIAGGPLAERDVVCHVAVTLSIAAGATSSLV
jgi:hypothetical protein